MLTSRVYLIAKINVRVADDWDLLKIFQVIDMMFSHFFSRVGLRI